MGFQPFNPGNNPQSRRRLTDSEFGDEWTSYEYDWATIGIREKRAGEEQIFPP
jgi:hypothetical protein